eukprot:UN19809
MILNPNREWQLLIIYMHTQMERIYSVNSCFGGMAIYNMKFYWTANVITIILSQKILRANR